MKEVWKGIPDWEGYYEVSDMGHVRSLPRVLHRSNGYQQTIFGRLLKPRVSAYGHLRVALCRPGRREDKCIHQLVLTAFVGPCPDGCEACHNDGDHQNNRLSNLRWDTHAANMADTARHGVRRGYKVRRSDGQTYRTCQEASKAVGVHRGSVARSIRLGQLSGGYTWEIVHV